MLWHSSIRLIAILFAVTAIFGVVGVSYAEDSPLSAGSTPQFCQRVDNLTSRLLEKTNEYYKSVSPVKFDRDEQLERRRAAFDKKLTILRNKAEEDRKRHIEAMLARTKSEAQSEAVEQYSAAVKRALDARHLSVDNAVRNYRNHVDSELKFVQDSRRANRQQFFDQVNIAIEQAKSDCADGNNDAASRQDITRAIDLARQTASADRGLLANTAESIRLSHEENKLQIIAAFTQFNESMERAKQQLVSTVGSLLQ